VLLLGLAAAGCAGAGAAVPGAPAHHRERGFVNQNPDFTRPEFWEIQRFRARRLWQSLTGSGAGVELPRTTNDGRTLRATPAGTATLTWIGHATFLIQLEGLNVLTDPQFSDRASPLSFAGPRRLNAPGLAFEDLPPIHVVVISHDHYDHLDRPTVERLATTHRPLFLVPLRLKGWFASIGVTDRVEELDWWESRQVGDVTVTCTPVQHWSARTPFDMNERLWAGWAVAGRDRRLYFGGDTGFWDPGFREIGARLGPFDVALIAIGAYEPPAIMRLTHTTPEEALALFTAVRARTFVAMHWGTFDLADEPIEEPPRRLRLAAERQGLDPERVWVLRHGETRSW
jgi:L-ascorbate metabolism protein UlaG (beta-lactamase superfamily)